MIELIMAEFGQDRKNCGNTNLGKYSRLEPTLSTMLKFFPNLKLTVYTDYDMKISYSNSEIRKVQPIFKKHKRYGNRCNDYYKILGLLESKYDISISMDSDMFIYSDDIKTLIPLTKQFGICVPANPRLVVKIDGIKGVDANYILNEDETLGNGFAYNMSPISFYSKDNRARNLLEFYCNEIKINTVRGPLVMWRAVWKSGIYPYLLPFQWCVCGEHIGMGEEIILHIGHKKVKEYYKI